MPHTVPFRKKTVVIDEKTKPILALLKLEKKEIDLAHETGRVIIRNPEAF